MKKTKEHQKLPYDPEKMIRQEGERLRALEHDPQALQAFWEKRYRDTYRTLLADRSEFGRYGVVAEYLLRLLPGGSVLDTGCGPGILAGLLKGSSLHYTGIDISEEAVALARKNHPELQDRFHAVALDQFEPGERFDALTAIEILYYLDAGAFFSHCSRLLKPGGHLIVTMYDFAESRKLLPEVEKHLTDPFRAEVYNAEKGLRWHVVAGKFGKDER
jgi:2-polyprenyl-3-methyl-5-hydroxy-6-metoxy-1,4-benzoquinol methylase